MNIKRARYFKTSVALLLASSMILTTASAVVKEVKVWGAKSANDIGGSDNRVTMDELKEDYEDYVQTDGLREYFHTDQSAPAKVDLGEALSWLIDNEIISRDQIVSFNNVVGNVIPNVIISKDELEDLSTRYLTLSDMIMYTYKAVFGPIDARTIGIETTNVRTDDGTAMTLYDIMEKHNYTTEVKTPIAITIMDLMELMEILLMMVKAVKVGKAEKVEQLERTVKLST